MMKIKNISSLVVFGLTTLLLISCRNNGKTSENTDSTKIDTTIGNSNLQDAPLTYEQALKVKDSLVQIFSWPDKYDLDLNDDGVKEEFIATEGYSRGMGYTLFSKDGNNWKLISANESIASGHLGINVLPEKNMGWHNFVALQPSGRDGVIESYYSWNGKSYAMYEQKEVNN